MADEQIIVDIKVDSKEVNRADKAIDELTESIEKFDKSIKDAQKNNKSYKKTIAELDKQFDEGTITLEEHTKQTKLLQKEIDKNNRTIAEEKQELSKLRRERGANIKLIKSEIGALERLEAKASLLNKAITKQETATKEGRKEYARLNKELKETNEQINEQRQAFADNTKNIGNYKQVLEGLQEVQPGVVGGIQGIGTAFKTLLSNPIVAFLAAIIGGLKILFDAFRKSESGSRILGKAMAALRGVFALITRAADKLGDFLEAVWDDPKKAAEDFGEALEKNLSRRMDGIRDIFSNIGDQIVATWEGDTEKLRAAMEKTQKGFNQAMSGMNEAEMKQAALEMAIATKRAEELAAAFVALEEAQRASRGTIRGLEKQIAILNAEFERLGEIAGDDTQNMEEMRQAAINTGVAAEKLAQKQVALAQARLSLINQEVAVRRSAGENIQDLLDEQAQAEVELTEARSQAAIAQQKILIEQRKIERDLFEQNLDILIDVGDKIKTEQEKTIANESLSLSKRRALLEGSRAALTANFGLIKKEYELYGVTAEQINGVITASDANQTNEKLKALGLNEIANNRLREIILERRQAELDFADLQKGLDKEEADRKTKAVDKIAELNRKQVTSQIEDAEELKNKLIKFEKAKLELLLENENLLNEEREALRLESSVKIQQIEENFTNKSLEGQKERLEERKEILTEFFAGLIEITNEFASIEGELFVKIGDSIRVAFEDGKLSAESALAGISMASSAAFSAVRASRQEDLANIETVRQRELEIAGDSEEAKNRINEKAKQKSDKIKLKQFKADKAQALISIGIQTAVASVKTAGSLGFPAAIPFIALVAALGIASAAIVATKKPPKFKDGTSNIVNIGGSHASGNDVDVYGISGNSRQYFGKVEKGEAMPVIPVNKVGYVDALLNNKFKPQKRVFQEGTPDITQGGQQAQGVDTQAITTSVVAAVKNIKIVAKIEDITREATKKIEIVEASKV